MSMLHQFYPYAATIPAFLVLSTMGVGYLCKHHRPVYCLLAVFTIFDRFSGNFTRGWSHLVLLLMGK